MRATIIQKTRAKKRKAQRVKITLRQTVNFIASSIVIMIFLSILFQMIIRIVKDSGSDETQGVRQYYSRSI